MDKPCGQCGGLVILVDDTVGHVCTECGDMANPDEIVLVASSAYDLEHDFGRTFYAGPSSIKNASGRALSGQSNAARFRAAKLVSS